MTKLSNIEVTDEVVEVLRQFVRGIDDEDILAYAQYGNKDLLKGLRPKKESAAQIKSRFVKQLGVQKISKENTGFLRRHNPYSFFDGLEEKTIQVNLDALCASLGIAKVEAILLLSDRPELTALAGRMISGEHAVKEVSGENVKKFASRTFHAYLPFMLELQGIFNPEPTEGADFREKEGAPAEKDAGSHSGPCPECSRLKETLNQVKNDLKGYKKEAVRVPELGKKLSHSEKRCKELSETVETLKKELADTQKEHELLHGAIVAQVNEELDSSLHSWLKEPRVLQQEVEKTKDGDLLRRVALVVEKQQEIDRHSGNRRMLARQLQEAVDARTQLAAFSRESLNPLPELPALMNELDREIVRLRRVLDDDPGVSAFAQNFMAKVGLAGSPNEVMEYRRVLETIRDAGVLEPADTRALFEYCDQRMDLAYDKYVPDVKDPEPVLSPFRRLKESILKNREMIWFLDGHNILFKLSDLFGMFGADGKPTESARYKLSDSLVALTAGAGQCQIRLYYDGPERSEYSPAENVKVIYSGGEGDHKADRAICADMEYLFGKASSVPFFITSDDFDLRKQAGRLSAIPLHVEDMYVLLRNMGLAEAESM